MGELNKVFGKRNIALIREAVAVLKEAGKCIGVSTGSADPAVIEFWNDLGINMISSGVDYDYLRRGAQRNLETIRRIQKCNQPGENCHEAAHFATC
jgi:2-keto-3-deoxy-L-rhamnonate aldolase RhmA